MDADVKLKATELLYDLRGSVDSAEILLRALESLPAQDVPRDVLWLTQHTFHTIGSFIVRDAEKIRDAIKAA